MKSVHDVRRQRPDTVRAEIAAYVSDVVTAITNRQVPVHEASTGKSESDLANEIFSLLTSRAFCYLSRKRVECYREEVVSSLRRRMATGEAFRFFYDIGPGYHATLRPGVEPLRFDVGLSELMILAQVKSLCRRIEELYEPGASFWLVIDNVCGLRTNDIPLDQTEGYVHQLRRLIDETDMSGCVDLIVESEIVSLEEYDRVLEEQEPSKPLEMPSPQDIDNVARFLGRRCCAEEAAERMELYTRTGAVTDALVNELVRDVHMTQRATGATLGFRPFPGGDQRTQAGELVLTRGSKGALRPILLTSRNVDFYDCQFFTLDEVLPQPIPYVGYAEKVSAS